MDHRFELAEVQVDRLPDAAEVGTSTDVCAYSGDSRASVSASLACHSAALVS